MNFRNVDWFSICVWLDLYGTTIMGIGILFVGSWILINSNWLGIIIVFIGMALIFSVWIPEMRERRGLEAK